MARRRAQISPLLVLAAVAGLAVVGFGVGWLLKAPRSSPAPAAMPIATQSFPLLPADRHHDRETPSLTIDGRGRVVAAWASQTGEGEFTIFLARGQEGAALGEPSAFRVVKTHRFTTTGSGGKAMTFSTHVQPRLATYGDTIVLGWTESEAGGPRVNYHVARSIDGGKSFTHPVAAHGADASRPGYIALARGGGLAACAWLESRNKAQQVFTSTVRDGDFSPGKEQLVYAGPDDKGVCPCCDTAVIQQAELTFIAFRNSDQGNRDVVVVRTSNNGTEPPARVSADRWALQGCPHDGPSLARSNSRLYAMWTSGHTGQRRVYLASSPFSRLDFTAVPLPTSPGREQGHPCVTALPLDQSVFTVWDEALGDETKPVDTTGGQGHSHGLQLTGSGRAILFAYSNDNGANFTAPVALAPRTGAFQVQPAIAVAPHDSATFVAWNEIDAEGKRVVVARFHRQPANETTAK